MFGGRREREMQARIEAAERRCDELQRRRLADLQLLDGLGEALLSIDRNRRVVFANRRFGELFGQTDVAGKTLGEVLRVAGVFETFDAALAGRESTVRFSVASGVAERRIEMRALPLASDDIAAVALFLDVTTTEHLEQTRSNFISDFSHEVRTPLAGLRSAVETFEANAGRLSPEDDQQLRRIMLRQLRRLERLVDDLAELSRIESGDLTLDLQPVDLRRVVDELVEDFAEQAARHRVRFTVRGQAVAIADPTRLQQAFSNLIDNAIKYGGDDRRVTIEIGADSTAGIVRITDEGEGIPPSEREKIFHRFYRVDRSRSQDIPGSGLGLAITKHLILRQHGSIDVESEAGRGATFIVRLPGQMPIPAAPGEASR